MSGICGIVQRDRNRQVTNSDLASMLRVLGNAHEERGSIATVNALGLAVQSSAGYSAGIAKMDVHGSILALAFYGNIYNLSDLIPEERPELDPATALLRMFHKSGPAALEKIRGEFVTALWDGTQETLYLATDRFRVHPLFYYEDNDKLVFSSKIKSILACPFPIKRTINPQAIVDVTASSVIPTPKTIFNEIRKLPPGYVLRYYKGDVHLTRYWDIRFSAAEKPRKRQLKHELKENFTEAVSVRLKNESLPDEIGTFLSGGVDSSTVTGVLCKLLKRPIKSFSIGFGETRYNEINYARIAARAFACRHFEYFVTPRDAYETIPLLLNAFDEPYANASAIPTYFCAKLASDNGVKVLYAGDGGDELFAGNERYADQRFFDYYHKIPRWIREPIVGPTIFALADQFRFPLIEKAQKYISRASVPYPQRLTAYGLFETFPMPSLFEPGFIRSLGDGYDTYESIYSLYRSATGETELDRQLYIDLKHTIADNDLFKVVRMTANAGIAVRFPFLDHVLAEFAASIPAHIKMKGRRLRSFFKETYADFLPVEIRKKTKHGFGLPIPSWLRTDKRLNEMMLDLLLDPTTIQRGYFQKNTLEELVLRHQNDSTAFYGTILWNLMILELWH